MVIKLAGQQNNFFFSEDMELLFAAVSLLMGEPNHSLCTKTFGSEQIILWKSKYSFLFEVYSSLDMRIMCGMLEPIMLCSLEKFSLEYYRDFLLSLKPEEFLQEFLQVVPKQDIIDARESDEKLQLFYEKYPEVSKSILGLSALLKSTGRLITDFITLASELKTDQFLKELGQLEQRLQKEQEMINSSLINMESLKFSEFLMGKTFHNRGPYRKYIFAPSLFLPYKALRFFDKDQILFYTIRNTSLKDEDVQKQLKALSDATRFQILVMLNKNGPLRGMDIAASLSIAASTVSHHMDVLYKDGLINEEQAKNTKYYSISRNNVDDLIKRLSEILGK